MPGSRGEVARFVGWDAEVGTTTIPSGRRFDKGVAETGGEIGGTRPAGRLSWASYAPHVERNRRDEEVGLLAGVAAVHGRPGGRSGRSAGAVTAPARFPAAAPAHAVEHRRADRASAGRPPWAKARRRRSSPAKGSSLPRSLSICWSALTAAASSSGSETTPWPACHRGFRHRRNGRPPTATAAMPPPPLWPAAKFVYASYGTGPGRLP